MEEDQRSAWAGSLLLRVAAYSISTSVILAGVAAWVWRAQLVAGKFDYFAGLAIIVCITSLLGYYLFGGALWLFHELKGQCSPSAKDE